MNQGRSSEGDRSADAARAPHGDTIVAPATGVQPAGVAVVRISGPQALAIGGRIAQRAPAALRHGHMRFGRLHGPAGAIDEGYVVAFRAPRSFTAEDVVEVHSHGAPAVVRALCDAAVTWGARPARAGEFTRRAWLSGRLDLTQAEALADLVSARSEAARAQAMAHLDGRLSEALAKLRAPMVLALADLEARLDFGTEEDVTDVEAAALVAVLLTLAKRMRKLAATAHAGRVRVAGARVALVGAPNAGKSTLFNALLGADRALVHHQPGTTRDLVEAPALVGPFAVTLVDTAGVRGDADEVEAAGIARAKAAAAASDLVLWLVDASQPAAPEGWELDATLAERAVPVLRLRTKADLLGAGAGTAGAVDTGADKPGEALLISALDAADVARVRGAIQTQLEALTESAGDTLVLTRERQAAGLLRAAEALDRGMAALQESLPLELPCEDLRDATEALDEVTGRVVPDDVLDAVFSRFCIGK